MNKEEYEALSPEEQERYKQEILQKKYNGVAPVIGRTASSPQAPIGQGQAMNSYPGQSPYPGQQQYDQGQYNQGQYSQGQYVQAAYNQGAYDQGAAYGQGAYDQGAYGQGQYGAPMDNPPMGNFTQSQYGSDAYDLSMQGAVPYGQQPEYGEADYKRMYGNVPNQQYDDGTSLPMTMEDAEEDKKRHRRIGRNKAKSNKPQPQDGKAGRGQSKPLPLLVVILVAVLLIGGCGFAAMKLGLIPDIFGGQSAEAPQDTGGQDTGDNPNAPEGQSKTQASNPYDSTFIGTWALYSLQDGSNVYDNEQIKNIAKDDEGYLLLFDDGTMDMKLIGNGSSLDGTWKAVSNTEVELNIGGNDRIPAVYANNILKIEYQKQALEFEKTANSATPLDNQNGTSSSNSGSLLEGSGASNTNSAENTGNANASNANAGNANASNANAGNANAGNANAGNANAASPANAEQPQTNTVGNGSSGGFVDVD